MFCKQKFFQNFAIFTCTASVLESLSSSCRPEDDAQEISPGEFLLIKLPLVNSSPYPPPMLLLLNFPRSKISLLESQVCLIHWFTFFVVKYLILWESKPWDLALETRNARERVNKIPRFYLLSFRGLLAYPEALFTILPSFLRKIVPTRATAL